MITLRLASIAGTPQPLVLQEAMKATNLLLTTVGMGTGNPIQSVLKLLLFVVVITAVIFAIGYLACAFLEWMKTPASTPDNPFLVPPATGNLLQQCGVCQQVLPMETLVPCGHMLCADCRSRSAGVGRRCPFCRREVQRVQPVFAP
mmetsp:Transcript_85447/g.169516  ORF Transcript_85447/g.169516 Transcript_85447/m.169516 type:complete len:146 (-) Transcript_85447:12-449(-)